MITQMLQWLAEVLKQNSCWHEYQWKDGGVVSDYQVCRKCHYRRK